MGVMALGYVGLGVSDLGAWRQFAGPVLGLQPLDGPDGSVRLRVDERPWRIELTPSPADDLAFVGWEVTDDAALDALTAKLEAAGHAVERDDGTLAARRGVARLVRCTDPIGVMCELYCGPPGPAAEPFVSPAGVRQFCTGDQGVGHIVLATPDMAASRAFYEGLLGFRLSDMIDMTVAPGFSVELVFLHCNPRHHTLALAPVPAPRKLHHLMLEVASLDEVGHALDRVQAAGTPLVLSLGKHSNDHMVSFYVRTPSGFEVEYGCGGRTIDDAVWQPARYDRTSYWGHARV